MATSGVDCQDLDRLPAGRRRDNVHAAAFQHTAQREDIARVVVHEQNGLPDEILVGTVQALQHALLFLRKIADDAVQEQRRFIEQAFRQFDALHDDAARHGVQPRVLLGRQLAASKYHDRNVGKRCRPCSALRAHRSPTCPAA